MATLMKNVLVIRTGNLSLNEEIYASFMNKKDEFDFNLIVPEPEIFTYSDITSAELWHATGYENEEEWLWNHWGTRSNAFEYYLQCRGEHSEPMPEDECLFGKLCVHTELEFRTSWSSPKPVFKALSKRFPTATFEITYYDEQFSADCGQYTLLNGEVIKSHVSPYNVREMSSEEEDYWEDFACKISGYEPISPEEMKKKISEWERINN